MARDRNEPFASKISTGTVVFRDLNRSKSRGTRLQCLQADAKLENDNHIQRAQPLY